MKTQTLMIVQILCLGLMLSACSSDSSNSVGLPETTLPISEVIPTYPTAPIQVAPPVSVESDLERLPETTLIAPEIETTLGPVEVTLPEVALEREDTFETLPIVTIVSTEVADAVVPVAAETEEPIEEQTEEQIEELVELPIADQINDEVEEIQFSGKCNANKTVVISVSDTRKPKLLEKVKVKCVKNAFTVRMSLKNKDLPFIKAQFSESEAE